MSIAEVGLPRDDVATTLGERYRASGFPFTWNTDRVTAGPHTLCVYACNTAGTWEYVTVPFWVAVSRQPAGATGATTGTGPGTSTGTATSAPTAGLPTVSGSITGRSARPVVRT